MKELLRFILLWPLFTLMIFSSIKFVNGDLRPEEFTDCGKITSKYKQTRSDDHKEYYKFMVKFDSLGHKEINVTTDTYFNHDTHNKVCFTFDRDLIGWKLFYKIIGFITIIIYILGGLGLIVSRLEA